ncbi:hypothetical protein H4S07_002128 [Coemansia furcata]|uniref:Uncharacterized protein n=1 Tax=Coemansia furcata TaxID=417177 RepID=A0ACC1LKX5_9FUNG|nr:hypothetical protein H4S07_002128 [Coemansia furcata]
MDWNQHQGSEYSPDGAIMNVSGHVGNGRASTYQRLAPDNKVKSGSVQKHRVETTTGSHSYILSPANTRRGGSSGASSQNDEDDNENHNMGGSSVEQQRRRRFLERNRMAASKCRQKKKVWIQDLERRAEDATAQNRALHIAVAQLKEEVLILKNQLLSHHNCGCSAVQQFMSPDSASSIDQTQAATAVAVAATAAGVFSLSSQQDMHSPRQQQHHMVHPSATAPSMLFQAPPPLLYHQPQPSPYHHHHQSSSVDMSVVPNGVVGTSGAANSFVGNMDGVN